MPVVTGAGLVGIGRAGQPEPLGRAADHRHLVRGRRQRRCRTNAVGVAHGQGDRPLGSTRRRSIAGRRSLPGNDPGHPSGWPGVAVPAGHPGRHGRHGAAPTPARSTQNLDVDLLADLADLDATSSVVLLGADAVIAEGRRRGSRSCCSSPRCSQRGLFSQLRVAGVAGRRLAAARHRRPAWSAAPTRRDRRLLRRARASTCSCRRPLGLSALVYCVVGYVVGLAPGRGRCGSTPVAARAPRRRGQRRSASGCTSWRRSVVGRSGARSTGTCSSIVVVVADRPTRSSCPLLDRAMRLGAGRAVDRRAAVR